VLAAPGQLEEPGAAIFLMNGRRQQRTAIRGEQLTQVGRSSDVLDVREDDPPRQIA
jgi:hypothetical protein